MVSRRPGRPHMTREQRAECLLLYATGTTINDLAVQFDRKRSVISKLVKRSMANRGHAFRPKGVRYGGRKRRHAAGAEVRV